MDNLTTKYINGAIYARSKTPYAYDLRIHDLGHGHVEATALPRYAWYELAATDRALADAAMSQDHVWKGGEVGEWVAAPSPSAAELEERQRLNRERSARRARTKVRRLINTKTLTPCLP